MRCQALTQSLVLFVIADSQSKTAHTWLFVLCQVLASLLPKKTKKHNSESLIFKKKKEKNKGITVCHQSCIITCMLLCFVSGWGFHWQYRMLSGLEGATTALSSSDDWTNSIYNTVYNIMWCLILTCHCPLSALPLRRTVSPVPSECVLSQI